MRLFVLGLAWAAGIFLADFIQRPAWEWGLASIPPIAAAWFLRDRPKLRLASWALAVLCLGGTRLELAQPRFPTSHLKHENDSGRFVLIEGVVNDFPDLRDAALHLTLGAETVAAADSIPVPAHGNVLVQVLPPHPEIGYGDRVRAAGYLRTPPDFEDFSYRRYLAARGVHSIMRRAELSRLEVNQANPLLGAIFDLRAKAWETVHALFPDPEASLMSGILLGIESGIPPDTREAFNQTGTSHIIAISGFNITIIAGVAIAFFGRVLGERRGLWLAGLTIVAYTVLVGADATVVRAAIMGSLALLARYLGRQTHALASLAGAAVLMTLVNPTTLWDVGFQLSFAATLGLILYADPVSHWFTRLSSRALGEQAARRLSPPVTEFVLLTFAAQLPTLPLSALHFGLFSPISALANPLILPLQPALMMAGGLATLLGMIWLPLGRPLAALTWPLPALSIRIVELLAKVPYGSVDVGRLGPLAIALLYLGLLAITAWLFVPAAWPPKAALRQSLVKLRRLPILSALALLTAVSWAQVGDRPDGRLTLTALPSEAVLIETPRGRFVLIGDGASPVALSEALGRRLPLLHREIDWLIPGRGRTVALERNLGRFAVRNALLPPHSSELASVLAEADVSFQLARAGQVLDLGRGAALQILAADASGISMQITYGHARLLVLAHAQWMRAADAVVFLPHADLAASLEPPPKAPILMLDDSSSQSVSGLRTAHYGWIQITSDGQDMTLFSERTP